MHLFIKRNHFAILLIVCLLPIQGLSQADANRQQLTRKSTTEIEKIAGSMDGVMGVAIKDLTSGEEILINDGLTFPTGSSIKIPVLRH